MNTQQPVTLQNLEAAFAGESMAHIKYLYFAKICRAHGDTETAKQFEETAAQEVQHALGHADLLYPTHTLNPVRCLELAIAGDHEYRLAQSLDFAILFGRHASRSLLIDGWKDANPSALSPPKLISQL